MKHVVLSDTMVLFIPNGWIIALLTNFATTSSVAYVVEIAKGQPVRCSTAIRTNRLHVSVVGSGPVKLIENTSKGAATGNPSVVLQLGMGTDI